MDEQYYQRQIKVVDERLALAGLRLAAVLNEVPALAEQHIISLEPASVSELLV